MNKSEFDRLVWESNMNQTAKLIALAVAAHGDWDTGLNVKPSKTRIAGMAECTRDTAGKYIDALEEQGWIKHVKTHKNNVKEYELMEQVAEPIGILAKRTRSISKVQKDNLKAANDLRANQVAEPIDNLNNQVAETKESRLPKLSNQVAETNVQVADGYGTTLLRPYSLTLQDLTSETPVADAPVPSHEIKEKRKRFLNGPETTAFSKLMFAYSVNSEDSELVKSRYEKGHFDRSLNFEEAVKQLLRDIDYEIGGDDEW